MKYLTILIDGAADEPRQELDGKTPLQAAKIGNINELAKISEIGTVNTVPIGMSPGSDIANLSVMGYDPRKYHTGRSPLEAASMGINLSETDVAYRCNLVTLEKSTKSDKYEEFTIIDHSAGDISTEEAEVLINALQSELGGEFLRFYPGVSYRHALIEKNGSVNHNLTPPHDILSSIIGEFLPKGKNDLFIKDIMSKSYEILKDHPINKLRKEKGQNPGNSAWIWGQGKKTTLPLFIEKFGVSGAVISAVDLIKGIGICAGLIPIDVEGATGTIHTNYSGKADAAIKEFDKGTDFVYIHIEAPDECSHQGDLEGKIKSIENIDLLIVKPLIEYLKSRNEDYKILVLPDHPTPISIRTHSSESVPFVLYDSKKIICNEKNAFDEIVSKAGIYFDSGEELSEYFFK